MLRRRGRGHLEFFVFGSLRDLVPDDHVLARVDTVLDLGWLHDETAEVYAPGVGRPAFDPEAAVRLMLTGFLFGIVHDRRLMKEAQVNLAIRWFAGFGLQDRLPDHSSLTRIRQRWGAERFRRIFQRSVKACVTACIAEGEVVRVDASLIRADVAWESLTERHLEEVVEVNDAGPEPAQDGQRTTRRSKVKTVCLTDPDATTATTARGRRLEPSYKQHGVVDDLRGVVLDFEIKTGQTNERQVILDRLDAAAATTGMRSETVTADAGYAYAKVFAGLEARKITGVIPTKAEPIRSKVPLLRFRNDAQHDLVKCPRGKILRPNKANIAHGRFFASKARARKGRAPWPRQHASPGLPDCHGNQPQAACDCHSCPSAPRDHPLCADFRLSDDLKAVAAPKWPPGTRLIPAATRGAALPRMDAFFNGPVVQFYRNVFSHVPSTKVREVSHMLKAIHAQDVAKRRARSL